MSDLVVVLSDAQLDALAERVAAKLANGNGNHAPPEPDVLLTAVEAAKRLGVNVRWIYAHVGKLPFAVRLPASRALRFSERGLARYVDRRTRDAGRG